MAKERTITSGYVIDVNLGWLTKCLTGGVIYFREKTTNICPDCGNKRELILEDNGDIIFRMEEDPGVVCLRCNFIMFKMIEFHNMSEEDKAKEIRRISREQFKRDNQ
tara:strand:+ start:180 stop:500 length:321 start_codon:yes stop_codon:yes gene_type:complete